MKSAAAICIVVLFFFLPLEVRRSDWKLRGGRLECTTLKSGPHLEPSTGSESQNKDLCLKSQGWVEVEPISDQSPSSRAARAWNRRRFDLHLSEVQTELWKTVCFGARLLFQRWNVRLSPRVDYFELYRSWLRNSSTFCKMSWRGSTCVARFPSAGGGRGLRGGGVGPADQSGTGRRYLRSMESRCRQSNGTSRLNKWMVRDLLERRREKLKGRFCCSRCAGCVWLPIILEKLEKGNHFSQKN